MPLPKANTYTTDYIYFLPERQRAELIDGVIYDMTQQSRLHQELISELHYKITNYNTPFQYQMARHLANYLNNQFAFFKSVDIENSFVHKSNIYIECFYFSNSIINTLIILS